MLALVDLSCSRGDRRLFSGMGLHIRPGQCWHLQGPNGAGKTTLLRAVCGLVQPDSGQVLWQDEDARQSEDFRRSLLYLGHQLALKDDFSALENLLIHARIQGESALTSSQAREVLGQLGLRGRDHLPVRVLSQGQKRRAALARLMVSRRRLWVLDEPLVALDAAAQQLVSQRLQAHLSEGGLVLMTSHQPVVLPGVTVHSLGLQP